MYEIAVCDDKSEDRSRLIKRIKASSIGNDNIRIHEYDTGEQLLDDAKDISFGIIFLDVQMEGLDGDETAVKIREFDTNVVLVFYTGFADPSPRTFEVQPYRYIMKNMPDKKMDGYIEAALGRMIENSKKPKIMANINREQLFIKAEHIIFIEKFKKSTRAQLVGYAYQLYGIEKNEKGYYPNIRIPEKIETLYEKLKRFGFGQPHNSHIINFTYMISCKARSLKMAEVEYEFQVSRSKVKDFHDQKDHFMKSKYIGDN